MIIGLYPGTFDPITNGHLDIIERSARLFDHLVVGLAINRKKVPLFTLEERLDMLNSVMPPSSNISIDHFEDLLVNYAHKRGVTVLVRGLRAVSDFEFELQMALMNRHLDPNLETVFLMPSQKYSYLSSSTVRELASFNGDVSDLVPALVEKKLRAKFAEKNT